MKSTDWGRYLTRYAVLTYLGVVLMAPVAIILWRTFRPGFGQFYAWITTPAAVLRKNSP